MDSRRTTMLTAAGITAAVSACLTGAAGSLWVAVTDHESRASTVLVAGFMVAFVVVGAIVAAARPRNRVGWVMLAGAALSALGNAGASLAHHGIVSAPGSVSGVSAYAVAGQCCRSFGWYLLTLGVPSVFPDGVLHAGRRRWLAKVLAVVLIASVVGPLTDMQADLTGLGAWRNPIAPTGALRFITNVAFLAQAPLGVVALGGVVVQLVGLWRRGGALLRQQLSLFVAAAAVPIVATPLVLAIGTNLGAWVFGATALPLPIAIGFAVLARGLYDLRTAANRTLVWVTLSAAVAGIYGLIIAGVGNQLDVRHEAWLPWLAAAVIAVSFAPLRDTLQRGVNRLTFGRWDEPYDVLAALGQRLEATGDVSRLLDQVVVELQGLGLAEVAIRDMQGTPIAGVARCGDGHVDVPLLAYGEHVGTLTYVLRAPLRARDRQLLDDLAGHLAGVLHAYTLTLDLQRARERLVLAREEERRRLRRDLHDGLGPSLAGHVLRLDLVASKLDPQSPAAPDAAALRDDLRATMLEVRRVVEGLRPPALDELGLTAAISQVAQRLTAGTPTRIDMRVDQLPPLPAALEVAAFRIVTEAVNNVVRHAEAANCVVRISAEPGMLRLEVGDDGRGLDTSASTGHGLSTMRERAEELRGRLSVTADGGTRVVAELPLPPAPRTAFADAASLAIS